LHEHGLGGRGLLTRQESPVIAEEARIRGERIVMTNGCFDILHTGHVTYLEEAKTRGDRLIVAVNDDASVTRLKGAGRPINTLADRMAVLAGLAAVDWVVPFSEDTPAEIVAEILPDVLVKGGDYTADSIAGGKTVLENGGTVEVLSYREGRSTSSVIEAIRNTTAAKS
jgi:D-beta-D-heptose 7-phosphate kinase/D-beta-D-heptose 1-phosphate adenosyltransferase